MYEHHIKWGTTTRASHSSTSYFVIYLCSIAESLRPSCFFLACKWVLCMWNNVRYGAAASSQIWRCVFFHFFFSFSVVVICTILCECFFFLLSFFSLTIAPTLGLSRRIMLPSGCLLPCLLHYYSLVVWRAIRHGMAPAVLWYFALFNVKQIFAPYAKVLRGYWIWNACTIHTLRTHMHSMPHHFTTRHSFFVFVCVLLIATWFREADVRNVRVLCCAVSCVCVWVHCTCMHSYRKMMIESAKGHYMGALKLNKRGILLCFFLSLSSHFYVCISCIARAYHMGWFNSTCIIHNFNMNASMLYCKENEVKSARLPKMKMNRKRGKKRKWGAASKNLHPKQLGLQLHSHSECHRIVSPYYIVYLILPLEEETHCHSIRWN